MNLYATEIKAINPHTNELRLWAGPNVKGVSFQDAQNYCDDNIGYCKVVGLLVADIYSKDIDLIIDYELPKLN